MGSSDKPKRSGLPKQMITSGEDFVINMGSSNIPIGLTQDAEDSLSIWLVQIDPQIHAKTSIGDNVAVFKSETDLRVITPTGRLGNIPLHAMDRVLELGLSSGFVENLIAYPLKARVQLVH
jgi:hypothetical protein